MKAKKVTFKSKTKKTKHFLECYIVRYPKDPERYCTCMSWGPEI